jgi:hypothetical protein
MATVELGATATADLLVARLAEAYAVEGPLGAKYANLMANFLKSVDPNVSLQGPRLVTSHRYELAATQSQTNDAQLRMAVAMDATLFVDVGEGWHFLP